jgi:hypothetical protein
MSTEEETMSNAKLARERPRVVCLVDASSTAAAIVKAAASYCRRRDAELVLVWVLEPSSFRPTLPCSAGGTGIWGVSGAAAVARDLARKEGVVARLVVRIGDAGRVRDEERRSPGAERVFTAADLAWGSGAPLRSTSGVAAVRSRRRSRRTSPSAPRRGG